MMKKKLNNKFYYFCRKIGIMIVYSALSYNVLILLTVTTMESRHGIHTSTHSQCSGRRQSGAQNENVRFSGSDTYKRPYLTEGLLYLY